MVVGFWSFPYCRHQLVKAKTAKASRLSCWCMLCKFPFPRPPAQLQLCRVIITFFSFCGRSRIASSSSLMVKVAHLCIRPSLKFLCLQYTCLEMHTVLYSNISPLGLDTPLSRLNLPLNGSQCHWWIIISSLFLSLFSAFPGFYLPDNFCWYLQNVFCIIEFHFHSVQSCGCSGTLPFSSSVPMSFSFVKHFHGYGEPQELLNRKDFSQDQGKKH